MALQTPSWRAIFLTLKPSTHQRALSSWPKCSPRAPCRLFCPSLHDSSSPSLFFMPPSQEQTLLFLTVSWRAAQLRFHYLNYCNESQPGAVLFPRRHSVMSADVFGCHNWGWYWHLVGKGTRNAAIASTTHRQPPPPTKDYLGCSVDSAESETWGQHPCSPSLTVAPISLPR